MIIPTDGPRAVAAVAAIRTGDVAGLAGLLADHPELVTAALGSDQPCGGRPGMTRTLLHVVTDWPGHHPNGAATVRVLVTAGADVNARFTGPHTETPRHRDTAALGSQQRRRRSSRRPSRRWRRHRSSRRRHRRRHRHVRRHRLRPVGRLLERGAQTTFWEAATLGLKDRVEAGMASTTAPSTSDVTEEFWGACHGGQLAMARYLLDHGADMNWVGWDNLTPLDAARRSGAQPTVDWLAELGAGP